MLLLLAIINFEKYTIITNSALWLILIWICKAWKRLSQCSPSSFFKRLKMHHNLCPCCSLSLKTTTTIPWRLGFPKSSVKTISFVFMSVTDNSKLTTKHNLCHCAFRKALHKSWVFRIRLKGRFQSMICFNLRSFKQYLDSL